MSLKFIKRRIILNRIDLYVYVVGTYFVKIITAEGNIEKPITKYYFLKYL